MWKLSKTVNIMVNIMSNAKTEVVSVVTSSNIEPLGQKATQAEIIDKLNEIVQKVNNIKVRDRGPKSERSMTDDDARRVKFGDLKDESHKKAAEALGLSYGQIYSARGGYTFTHVKKEG